MGRVIDTEAPSYGRETAAEDAKETLPRTLTEDEAYAIVADRVMRETAELTAKLTTSEREKSELATKLETAEAQAATEKAAREKAEQDLKDLSEAADREKAASARLDERFTTVREAAYHLADEFFTAERKTRWAGMDDEGFAAYVAELAQMAEASGVVKPKVDLVDGAPRETAMHGDRPVAKTGKTGNLGKLFGTHSRSAAAGATQKGV